MFKYGVGHCVDFTDESGLYKPVLVSAREIALPEAKPFTHGVQVPDHIEAHCRHGCPSHAEHDLMGSNPKRVYVRFNS